MWPASSAPSRRRFSSTPSILPTSRSGAFPMAPRMPSRSGSRTTTCLPTCWPFPWAFWPLPASRARPSCLWRMVAVIPCARLTPVSADRPAGAPGRLCRAVSRIRRPAHAAAGDRPGGGRLVHGSVTVNGQVCGGAGAEQDPQHSGPPQALRRQRHTRLEAVRAWYAPRKPGRLQGPKPARPRHMPVLASRCASSARADCPSCRSRLCGAARGGAQGSPSVAGLDGVGSREPRTRPHWQLAGGRQIGPGAYASASGWWLGK